MSYCRFSEADAYIYDDIRLGIICCACSLMPVGNLNGLPGENGSIMWLPDNFVAGYDYDLMLAHIAEHREQGDYIPEDVDERLIFERDCNHEFNSDAYCKHCWRSRP